TFHIYPYIDQVPLFRLMPTDAMVDVNTLPGGPAALSTLDRTTIPGYYCPARRSIRLYHNNAVCDYAGNAGTNGSDGVIVLNNNTKYTKVHTGNVRDGVSNTLLVGERRINLTDMETGNDCYDNEPAVRPANDCDVLRRAVPSGGSWL